VAGYAEAMEIVFNSWESIPFTENHIKQLHVLIVIGIFIVRFLAIHHFQDGNGGLSRVLTTLLLLQAGYSYVPYSSLESVIEENKDSYYLALRKTQSSLLNPSPNWESCME